MSKLVRVTFKIHQDKLGLVVELLRHEVQDWSISPVENAEHKHTATRDWKASKTASGKHLLDGMKSGRNYTISEMEEIIVEGGWKPSTAGALSTRLVQEKKIERLGRATYRLKVNVD